MTSERLEDLKKAIEMAISLNDCGAVSFRYESPGIAARNFRNAGAVPRIHHAVIGDFAITDLRKQREEIATDFYTNQDA